MTQFSPTGPGSFAIRGISHVLLDIEGTTCPVSFISQHLFPYAAEKLASFLDQKQNDATVCNLVRELANAGAGTESECQAPSTVPAHKSILPYLRWLIEQDIKLSPWKELQGLIWRDGYESGQLIAPLFQDVPDALRQWKQQGRVLAVYSSGSIDAQQLLYAHTTAGNLTAMFNHWFDTRIGSKKESQSYREIATAMEAKPEQILFISDAISELKAASNVGIKTVFSLRPGNPETENKGFAQINSFEQITLL